MLSQHQHLVLHAGRRDDGTVLHGKQVLYPVWIDEIKRVTLWDGRQFMSIDPVCAPGSLSAILPLTCRNRNPLKEIGPTGSSFLFPYRDALHFHQPGRAADGSQHEFGIESRAFLVDHRLHGKVICCIPEIYDCHDDVPETCGSLRK